MGERVADGKPKAYVKTSWQRQISSTTLFRRHRSRCQIQTTKAVSISAQVYSETYDQATRDRRETGDH